MTTDATSHVAPDSSPRSDRAASTLVLFVHGMWMGAWIWNDVLAELAPGAASASNPIELEAIDLPGHGSDPTDVTATNVRTHINAVADRLDRHRLEHPAGARILVGHSMGTLVAMHAAQRSDVDALVLINPGPPRGLRVLNRWSLPHLASVILPSALRRSESRLSLAQATRFMLHPLSAARRQAVHAQLGPEAPATIREVVWLLSPRSTLGDPRPLAAADIVVAAGTDDRIGPAEQLLPAIDDWAGGVRTVTLDGVGHLAPIEAPTAVADLVRSTITGSTTRPTTHAGATS